MPRLLSDSSVPTWLRDMGRKEQADFDAHYKDSLLPQWQSRKQAWIWNAQMNVDRGLPVTPWNDPPPRRSVFLVDSSEPALVQILAPADPSLTAPVMPVKTPAPPSQFFVTGVSGSTLAADPLSREDLMDLCTHSRCFGGALHSGAGTDSGAGADSGAGNRRNGRHRYVNSSART